MPRPTIKIDQSVLTTCVTEVEANGPLSNQSAVFAAVTQLYNVRKPADHPEIAPHMVRMRVEAWGITLKTPMGRRGVKAGPMSEEHKAALAKGRQNKGKGRKRFDKPANKVALVELRKRTPVKLNVLVERVAKGSLKAAVKLHCIQCMGYEHAADSIRNCTCPACPLFAFRPYQQGEDTPAEDEVVKESEAA